MPLTPDQYVIGINDSEYLYDTHGRYTGRPHDRYVIDQISGNINYGDLWKLDASLSVLFGKKTTMGQICSYAKAVDVNLIDSLPGYCCLDKPSEINVGWGEKFSCLYEYGEYKGRARPFTECLNRGPWWTGFNENSCDEFDGTWCAWPRSCSALLECIANMKEDASTDETRRAFFAYLNDAPVVKDTHNLAECGNLREYFGYDKDFPDDNRICSDVESLQCRNDFLNLDNLGENTGSGDSDVLVSMPKLHLRSKGKFQADYSVETAL